VVCGGDLGTQEVGFDGSGGSGRWLDNAQAALPATRPRTAMIRKGEDNPRAERRC
jgi:hypothetical protein